MIAIIFKYTFSLTTLQAVFANLQSISFLEFNALNADFENIQRLAHISTAATHRPWKRVKFRLKIPYFLPVKAILAGCHTFSLRTLKCFLVPFYHLFHHAECQYHCPQEKALELSVFRKKSLFTANACIIQNSCVMT